MSVLAKRAFTLLELLISISLSSFIILFLLQGYNNASRFIKGARMQIAINRKICLFFNQIERDLQAAFIPEWRIEGKEEGKDEKDTDSEGKKSQKVEGDSGKEKSSQKNKDEKEEEKKKIKFFTTEIFEDDTLKVWNEKLKLCKNINFVTTNALQIYGQRRIRLVRVRYELVKNKALFRKGIEAYDLYRKEVLDIDNFKFEEKEGDKKEKYLTIRSFLVIDNVKGFFCRLIPERDVKEEKEKGGAKKLIEDLDWKKIAVYQWGEKEKEFNKVPEFAEITVVLWDDNFKKSYPFRCVIPILSFPTEKIVFNEETTNATKAESKNKQKSSQQKSSQQVAKDAKMPLQKSQGPLNTASKGNV